MATIVGGIGTPHSPMVGIAPSGWVRHGELEREKLAKLDHLVPTTRKAEELEAELALDVMTERYDRLQAGLTQMTDTLLGLEPDVLVIVGDDQRELFLDDAMPAVSVFLGDTLWDRPPGSTHYPSSMRDAYRWYHAEVDEAYTTCPGLAFHMVECLIADSFDVAQFSEQPAHRSLGHAFTFVYRRLLPDRSIPFVPVMLNTYYPPNQPRPSRCIDLGRSLAAALRSWPVDCRVALVASGGLSHPIVDEELDQRVLNALVSRDESTLCSLPLDLLLEGSSEIRNWLAVMGALEGADATIVDYVPSYRSDLGSGCGMGFMTWRME